MTETQIVTTGGTVPSVTGLGSTPPTYSGAGLSTVSGSVVTPPRPQLGRPEEPDPVLAWLTSEEAARYRNHWVALDPVTGALLGLTDEIPDLRRWQAEGALIVFVDPPAEAQLNGLGDFHPLGSAVTLEFGHFRSYRRLGSPRMSVEFRSRGPAPRNQLLGSALVLVVVDSGSDVTMLPRRFAAPLHIRLDMGAVTTILGAGGARVPCYPRVELEARLCGAWVTLPVRFFATAAHTRGLLGRAGAFDALQLAFDHSRELIYARRLAAEA